MTFEKVKRLFSFVGFSIFCLPAFAQSALEHHAWQDGRTFESFSTSADMVTGAIRLSGSPRFAVPGSVIRLKFENGEEVVLTSVGASWRQWDMGIRDKTTAEVFKVSRDPGQLRNGNWICTSSGSVRYVVFFEAKVVPMLIMAAFNSKKEPYDIRSNGLCGTFGYSLD